MTSALEKSAAMSALMRAIAQGDENGWRELLAAHQDDVYNYFYHLTRDAQKAEDYTQEVFLRVWKSAQRYVPTATLRTYIMRIARNFWIDRLRPAAVRELAIGDDDLIATVTPLMDLAAQETQAQINAALTQLPDKYREIIIWAFIEDIPYQEIAEILQVPLGTVKSRIFYALKFLRRRLGVNDE